jgi:hypothetical protein
MDREKYNRFVSELRKNIAEGMIKVHVSFPPGEWEGVAGENLWARPIGKKYAKIDNIPFFALTLGLDDIVEIDPASRGVNKEYVRTISRGSWTAVAVYREEGDSDEVLRRKYAEIKAHVGPLGIRTEGSTPGVLSLAIPTTVSIPEASRILSETPHVTSHSLQEADPDDYEIDYSDWGEG